MGAEEACGRNLLLTAAPRKYSQRDHRPRKGRAVRHRCGGRPTRKAVAPPAPLPTTAAAAAGWLAEVATTCSLGLHSLHLQQGDVLKAAEVRLEQGALAAPIEATARAPATTLETTRSLLADEKQPDVDSQSQSEVAGATATAAVTTASRSERHVHFDEEESTWFHITPYSEVYGMHPRLFDFDRNYWMVPSMGPPASCAAALLARLNGTDEEDEEEDSDTDLEEGWYEVLDDDSFEELDDTQPEEMTSGGNASSSC